MRPAGGRLIVYLVLDLTYYRVVIYLCAMKTFVTGIGVARGRRKRQRYFDLSTLLKAGKLSMTAGEENGGIPVGQASRPTIMETTGLRHHARLQEAANDRRSQSAATARRRSAVVTKGEYVREEGGAKH